MPKPKEIKEAQKMVLDEKSGREKLFKERLELLQKEFGCSLSIQVTLEQSGDLIKINKRLAIIAGDKP